MSKLKLNEKWDKIFPLSDKVEHRKVTFPNRYGIELAADLYRPKNVEAGQKLPAVAVAGPFGAVKEQAAGLYAQEMAERGFLAIAFDPSFVGESGGEARNIASPDINTEDFQAAVDYLCTSEETDPEKVGIIGICGFGGMALNAAAADTRIRGTVTSTMYDMSRVNANGYFDKEDSAEIRNRKRKELNRWRTENFRDGSIARDGGLPSSRPEDTPQFLKDYFDFYKTPRGYHPRSVNSNGGWNITTPLTFMNMPLLQYSQEIESPVLMIHGSKAHSLYFSEDAFKKLKGDNKHLMIIDGANHTDLYDQIDIIPFDQIAEFMNQSMNAQD